MNTMNFPFPKAQLDTPALVLNLEIFERNLVAMRDYAVAAGKKLRPHAKTHKCAWVAGRQLAVGGCVGICTAKVSEARAMLTAGIHDILITSPVVTEAKIAVLLDCAAASSGIMVVVDSAENAERLSVEAQKRQIILNVLVDIDPEMGRTGVSFEAALPLAQEIVTMPGLRLRGIQCYAGNLQHLSDYPERRDRSTGMMQRAAAVFRQFRAAGLEPNILAGTGTGTFEFDLTVPELTDIQVGSYCVMDAEYLHVGSRNQPGKFELFRPALTVLATVVSNNQTGFVTVDAGLKTLYFTPHAPPEILGHPDWSYAWFGDEHGKVSYPDGQSKPELGSTIELIVPHCDPTINLFDRLWLVRGSQVVDCRPIEGRGLSY